MRYGIVLFTSDRGIRPARAAQDGWLTAPGEAEALFGTPDLADDEVVAYLRRLAGTLGLPAR